MLTGSQGRHLAATVFEFPPGEYVPPRQPTHNAAADPAGQFAARTVMSRLAVRASTYHTRMSAIPSHLVAVEHRHCRFEKLSPLVGAGWSRWLRESRPQLMSPEQIYMH